MMTFIYGFVTNALCRELLGIGDKDAVSYLLTEPDHIHLSFLKNDTLSPGYFPHKYQKTH